MNMQSLNVYLQYLVPQHALSRFMGYLGNCRWTWFKNLFIQFFIKHYHVDMSAAQEPNPQNYACFNDFFTRALKPNARPITQGKNEIASPADGNISQLGQINAHRIIQAKGFDFDVMRLLGGSAERAEPFKEGIFVTIYLAPKDYHRVHMPVSGTLQEMIYIPGHLFSVNQQTAARVPNLFARNERVVCIFDTAFGPMALVLVGAMIVGSMETVWAGPILANKTIQQWSYQEHPIRLDRGEEMGRFKMGSTVIVLFGSEAIRWVATELNSPLYPGTSVQLGQKIGSVETDNQEY